MGQAFGRDTKKVGNSPYPKAMTASGRVRLPLGLARHRELRWLIVDALIALFSMWLASSRRLLFLDAAFDDRLFARLANSIMDGQWLGSYDKLTLAKGPGYPAFMALTSYAGIPLRLAEQAVYLLGCWLVSRAIWRLSDHRLLSTAVFTAGALNPVLWGDSLARVVREDLYAGLTVVVLGLSMLTFLTKGQPRVRIQQIGCGILLGAAFGWFWLTREEGMWLVPSFGMMAAYWLVHRWSYRPASNRPGYAAATLLVIMVPCAVFTAVDLGVAALNYKSYGVFETNDFRSSEFRAAYGALSRIENQHWQRLIPVPRDARMRAYEVSPAAKELQPFLEGSVGKFWQQIGCTSWPIEPCNDIEAGWFMWALRDSVEGAHHYTSAPDAKEFYARLARELNSACNSDLIACVAPHTGFLPPLRREYLPFIVDDAERLVTMLGELGGEAPATRVSTSAPKVIREFRRVAGGPWAGQDRVYQGDRLKAVQLRGWTFATKGVLSVRVVRQNGEAIGGLVNERAPDVLSALNSKVGTAVRFEGVVRCDGNPCQLEVVHDGRRLEFDIATLQPGPVPIPGDVQVWLDEAGPAQLSKQPRDAARVVTEYLSVATRTISVVLLPFSIVTALILVVLDLRIRRLPALTLLWLTLLTGMAARTALLAVLDATSLPAISTLYLSPAVGLELLFMAAVIGDLMIRLVSLRPAYVHRWLAPALAPRPSPDDC